MFNKEEGRRVSQVNMLRATELIHELAFQEQVMDEPAAGGGSHHHFLSTGPFKQILGFHPAYHILGNVTGFVHRFKKKLPSELSAAVSRHLA